MPVLTPARRRALMQFETAFQKAAHKLGRYSKEARVAAKSARTVPIRVFDRDVLEKKGSSVTMGSRNTTLVTFGNGPFPKINAKSVINMPANHLFYGDKLTFKGAATLAHELSHAHRNVGKFAKKLGMNHTQAEEFLADVTSAAILSKMGFSREKIVSHFRGRGIVYGRHFSRVMRLINRAARGYHVGYKVKPKGLLGFLVPHKKITKRKRKSILGRIVGGFASIFVPGKKVHKRGLRPSRVHRLTPGQLRKAKQRPWAINRARRAPLLREKSRLRRR